MALTQIQQISEAIGRASNILVVFRYDSYFDNSSAAIALESIIKKNGKATEIVASGWTKPKELQFLPATKEVKTNIEHLQKFLIEVDVEKTPVKELSYDIKENKLLISLVPKAGGWQERDVSSRKCDFRFDLICTIGVPDFKSLGKLFEEYADFFYKVPIINIDNDPANEHYGQINLVDISKTTVSEIIYDFIKQTDANLMDENIATSLLTGIIGKTKSFKTATVSPQTLGVASELVTLGAKREEIVHNLYRTRTVSALRLWGRALARLKHDSNSKLVWTILSHDDFIHAGAESTELNGVTDELIINAPEAKAVLILYEEQNDQGRKIVGILHANRPFSATELSRQFGSEGSREMAKFEIKNKTLIEAETLVTESLKQRMKI